MMDINNKTNNWSIGTFENMFNLDRSGNFKTTVSQTKGQFALKNGKLVNVNRHSSNKGDQVMTADSFKIRRGLVTALARGGASEAYLRHVREELGLNPNGADQENATALPLSRRTVKAILTEFRSSVGVTGDKDGFVVVDHIDKEHANNNNAENVVDVNANPTSVGEMTVESEDEGDMLIAEMNTRVEGCKDLTNENFSYEQVMKDVRRGFFYQIGDIRLEGEQTEDNCSKAFTSLFKQTIRDDTTGEEKDVVDTKALNVALLFAHQAVGMYHIRAQQVSKSPILFCPRQGVSMPDEAGTRKWHIDLSRPSDRPGWYRMAVSNDAADFKRLYNYNTNMVSTELGNGNTYHYEFAVYFHVNDDNSVKFELDGLPKTSIRINPGKETFGWLDPGDVE